MNAAALCVPPLPSGSAMAAAAASAAAPLPGRCGRWWIRARGLSGDDAQAPENHAADRFAGLRMPVERLVVDALLDFEASDFVFPGRRDGFVEVDHVEVFRWMPGNLARRSGEGKRQGGVSGKASVS